MVETLFNFRSGMFAVVTQFCQKFVIVHSWFLPTIFYSIISQSKNFSQNLCQSTLQSYFAQFMMYWFYNFFHFVMECLRAHTLVICVGKRVLSSSYSFATQLPIYSCSWERDAKTNCPESIASNDFNELI